MMASISLVKADDIEQWANAATSPAILPKLIRMLIHTTLKHADIRDIDFAAGRGIYFPGWDGKTETVTGNRYVPKGIVRWEVGTNKDPAGKAKGDLDKRISDALNANPSETTYIFVTPRHWAGKDNWAKNIKAKHFWKDVRAYDASDLETWMEMSPAVHVWFSSLSGKCSGSVERIDKNWQYWSEDTVPKISAPFMLAGREDVSKRLQQWIKSESSSIALQADTRQEALAFFGAFLTQLPDRESHTWFDKSLIVQDKEAWNHLCTSQHPLIIVPMFDEDYPLAQAVENGHKVLTTLDFADPDYGAVIKIPRLPLLETAEVLQGEGVPYEKAYKLAKAARRSLISYRRQLSKNPRIKCPAWAKPENAQDLIPVLLTGKWSEDNENDRKIIERLGLASYGDVCRPLISWANKADQPLRRIGSTWYLVSREDAWALLARHLNANEMDSFMEVALEVLGTPDPTWEQPDNEQWKASIHDIQPKYSDLLCQGIAETLAQMGTRGEEVIVGNNRSISGYASQIVRKLLEKAISNLHLLETLSSVLPLLAEAAPDVFLELIDEDLQGNDPMVLKLYRDTENLFASRSPHTGLLFALETLCWSPDHLGRSALLLAQLDRLDPGGRLLNRPGNSLREIFLPWLPSTSADLEQRLQVLKSIYRQEPEVAWKLLINLLPTHHDTSSSTAKPSWREWSPDSAPKITYGEIWKTEKAMIELLIADVGESGERWKGIIEKLGGLQPDQRALVLEHLSQVGQKNISISDRNVIWHALRELIAHHRPYPNTDWALPPDFLDQLVRILNFFQPQEPLERYGWLFNSAPALIEGYEGDYKVREAELERLQLCAIKEVFHSEGLDGVIVLAEQVERPELAGFIFGKSGVLQNSEESFLAERISFEETSISALSRGYLGGRIAVDGREWAEELLAKGGEWSSDQKATILFCMPCDSSTWDLAEDAGKDVEKKYWEATHGLTIPSSEDIEKSIKKLLEFDLPWKAMILLSHRLHLGKPITPALVIKTFRKMIEVPPEDRARIDTFYISQLFDYLYESDDVDEEEMMHFEWTFLPILRHHNKPKALNNYLAKDPKFFVEVVSIVYLSEGEEQPELSEDAKTKAEICYRLLHDWEVVPGTQPDGTIDYDQLKNWIVLARKELEDCGRGKIGESLIGRILAFSPEDVDRTWPCRSVRDIIEEIANRRIGSGFIVAERNKRGVVSKGLHEGGKQERILAQKYESYAELIAGRWPKSEALLRDISKSYVEEARREDRKSELRQDL